MPPLRVLFFGMDGVFSRAPLAALLDSEQVCAVIVPRPMQSVPAAESIRLLPPPNAPESDVPILFQPNELNAIGMAWNGGIPVYEVASLSHPLAHRRLVANRHGHPRVQESQDSRHVTICEGGTRNEFGSKDADDDARQTLAVLADLKPDVICVACFPRLLPEKLLSLPKYGAMNLHPSLLPAYRGPSPLFWIFHDGLEHAGITLHLMEAHADTGDIVSQKPIILRDGITFSEAERVCSGEGARLILEALRAIREGKFMHTPQPPTNAPRAPNPTEQDYIITPDWSARRAFNFIRGIAEWNHPITLAITGKRLIVRAAIAFDEKEELREAYQPSDELWRIRCSKGTLTVTAFNDP